MTIQPDSSQPDPSDDYGYDLAHEVKAAQDRSAQDRSTLQVPTASRDRERPASRPADERTHDSDGDLGYDDVHDF